jgi:hypothetical protein
VVLVVGIVSILQSLDIFVVAVSQKRKSLVYKTIVEQKIDKAIDKYAYANIQSPMFILQAIHHAKHASRTKED